MSWRNGEYASGGSSGLGRLGSDWHGMRPTFDNPFTWSLPLGRIAGISIRVHVFFLVFIVIMLLRAALPTSTNHVGRPLSFGTMAIGMAVLFVIVLLHEFGHCIACRRAGGDADEILLWPLGGLAFTEPGPHWKAHLITVLGGPIVNLVICLLAGTTLGILTGQWLGVALPNPLNPAAALGRVDIGGSLLLMSLCWINQLSLIVLLFNLLPVFPLDGGRIVHASLWSRFGYSRAMQISVQAGYIGAIVLGIFGAVLSLWLVVAVALFGGITCYMKQKQLQWSDSTLEELESDELAWSLHHGPQEQASPPKATWRQRQAERRAAREEEEAREVDRILQKIADSGLESLSRSEQSLLKRVTERKRRGE